MSTEGAQTHHLGVAVVTTTNTKEAAMLLTLGVPFADPEQKDLVRNIYSEKKPFVPGHAGEITYLLGAKTAEGVRAAVLREAFAGGIADSLLDQLVGEIEAANPVLGNRLRALLPKALASYARGFFENRERILDLWKRCRPMVLIRKSEKSFALIPRDANATTRKQFGV